MEMSTRYPLELVFGKNWSFFPPAWFTRVSKAAILNNGYFSKKIKGKAKFFKIFLKIL
jgi:hypothetical protein